ncbi:MAG TPA: EAL domain-containing response regulator [Thermoanaerobaculia bacterium]|jgi:EAL domain-containing protein (putative c-di-GMP-specific phosphodiesterase class I)
MSAREHVLVIDDDRSVAEGLALLLERDGRTTIVCSDVESAEIILTRYPVTQVVSDVQFSGAFGFEGLHFLARIRAQRPECRIVLMTGHATETLRTAALGLGASAVLAKPFSYEELEAALASSHDGAGAYELVRVAPIEDVLHGGLLSAAFQPIVRLGDTSVFAFEALTRIRGNWPGGGPAELFQYASRCARLADLNLAALECAVADGRCLPDHAALFINIDPLVFEGGELAAALRTAAARAAFPLSRIVLEITERSGFGDDAAHSRTFDELRADGVRFALDDHGSAYSHLSMINVIRPSFIKISQSFGTGFEEDETRARIVKHVVSLARDFGCSTVLEGIESASTARAAASLGIELAQGYHFGRPDAVSHWRDTRVAA